MIPNHFDEQILNNDLILKFACCSFFDRKRTKKNEMKFFQKKKHIFFSSFKMFKNILLLLFNTILGLFHIHFTASVSVAI